MMVFWVCAALVIPASVDVAPASPKPPIMIVDPSKTSEKNK